MTTARIRAVLETLIEVMPLHAEEGTLREAISEADLVSKVQTESEPTDFALAVVGTVRRVYVALGVLDLGELNQGRWAFVSYPASLFARSMLDTLSMEGRSFFGPDFWEVGEHQATEVIEQQRQLLMTLEKQRVSTSPDKALRAIRVVHVAWGLIRLGGRFVLYRREDKDRPESNRHVFPGGRLKPADLPAERQTPEALRDLNRADSRMAEEALPRTLARELLEEFGLHERDYQSHSLRRLAPYTQLEGSANTYSLSTYVIHIWSLKLTREAEFKVLSLAAAHCDQYPWFTAAEIANGRRADGPTAFVDALHVEFGADLEAYLSEEVPDSSTTPPTYRKENDAVQLPLCNDAPIYRGMTGRQQPMDFTLDERDWELLMILGWQSRGLPIVASERAMMSLGAGWVLILDDELLAVASRLAGRLASLGFPIVETDQSGGCRLSIDPSLVYFHPELFEYVRLDDEPKKRIEIRLKSIATRWARLDEARCIVPLEKKFTEDLNRLERKGEPHGLDFERSSRKHFTPARAIGLRQFTSSYANGYEIVVPQA